LESEVLMIASLLGILGGFILLMLGAILGIHSEHTTPALLLMFGGLVSMLHFLPYYKEYKDE
jgi:hypothetical protein